MPRPSLISWCAILLVANTASAISYIVPTDRDEIGRADTIISGYVLGSHCERSRFGIETVTEIALEETFKGTATAITRIHEPGGIAGDEARIVPGAPTLLDGEHVLLFLSRREDGSFAITDLQLGCFRFARDNELLVRDSSEIHGWDLDGTPHLEPLRSASAFLEFVHDVARGSKTSSPATDENVLKSDGGIHASPRSDAVYTASSYTMQYASGLGTRWNTFPNSVKWNQGNNESGPLGTGTSQITAAFAAWNAHGTNYVLATSNANSKGFTDGADGVNNFVFEKNLTAAGVQPFSCTSGGALGMGGMTAANFGGGAHVFRGETFGTTLEADVSMNQGLSACTAAQLTADQFKSVIVHELGHTLGLRHSDQNRKLNAACSTDPALECSGAAIMNHILLSGLDGQLQAWDITAVDAVYGNAAGCTPPSITAQPLGVTIVRGGSVQLSVSAAGTGPLSYQWYTGVSGDVSSKVSGGTGAAIAVSPQTTTSYWVRVTGLCAPAADSSGTIVTVEASPCNAPRIVEQPKDQTVSAGASVSLTIGYTGSGATAVWFEGLAGDSSYPAGTGPTISTRPLTQTTHFWARVTNSCGTATSSAATITVVPIARRRAAR